MKEDDEGKEDLVQIIKYVEENPCIDVKKLDRKSSVLIATAKIMTESKMDLSKLQLELPDSVQSNIEVMLKPYLSALKLDGYQKAKKRKAFVIGNTGKVF